LANNQKPRPMRELRRTEMKFSSPQFKFSSFNCLHFLFFAQSLKQGASFSNLGIKAGLSFSALREIL